MPPRRNTTGQTGNKLVVLTERSEEILKAIHFYRYRTALNVTQLLYAPTALKHVRSLLAALAGGKDEQENQYLYRFSLLRRKKGEPTRVYTLGSRGREVLEQDAGLLVDWYYRPEGINQRSEW